MKRLLLAVAAGLAVVALAGAVGLPDLAGAQDAAPADDAVTVMGVGSVEAVPNEAQMSFGVETRRPTAQAAVAANADAMRRVINALRQADAREIATQWVSVYPYTRAEDGTVEGYSASNSVSAVGDVNDAASLIDAAAEAGANQISGPGLSSSNADALYRQALADAMGDARARAEALVKAAGRSLGPITTIVESGGAAPVPYAERAALDQTASMPIVPGQQETIANVSVTFSLR
ncbi:MAG TPA: SIMPL domain-containing protein [Gaiellaceae bacterium]|nr:SIMPL domain-containing protein [Gaiellaceae bacterium]